MHGEVAHLGRPHKPVTLQEPDEKVPAETAPETTQQRGKGQMEDVVKDQHQNKVLEKKIRFVYSETFREEELYCASNSDLHCCICGLVCWWPSVLFMHNNLVFTEGSHVP